MGVDIGFNRIGVALGGMRSASVKPLFFYKSESKKNDLLKILKICFDFDIAIVVIGCSFFTRSGTRGNLGIRSFVFAKTLRSFAKRKKMRLNVYLFDESYTSKDAFSKISTFQLSKKKKKYILDEESACVLLRGFLII